MHSEWKRRNFEQRDCHNDLQPKRGFSRADEGTIAWAGHFQLGDHLIYAGNAPGTITFTLQQPVAGIGFEVQPNSGTFSATVQIFDSLHHLLSAITQPAIGALVSPPVTTRHVSASMTPGAHCFGRN
jgi:hypothetical protein